MNAPTLTLAATLMASTALADTPTRIVTFENEGAVLSGTLYLPEGHDARDRLPVVVVTGAWTTVEEQMPRTYAEAMVARGFAAVTFDFRGWGKSGDLLDGVRFKEDPAAKTSDLQAAFRAVAALPEVDPARISGLGICASAGYMLDAAAGNPLVRSVGLVAPWLQDRAIIEAVYGGAEGVAGLRALAAEAAAVPGGTLIPAGRQASVCRARPARSRPRNPSRHSSEACRGGQQPPRIRPSGRELKARETAYSSRSWCGDLRVDKAMRDGRCPARQATAVTNEILFHGIWQFALERGRNPCVQRGLRSEPA